MEEERSGLQEVDTSRTRVGFPQTKEPRKFPKKALFIILILIALVAVGWWFLFGREKENSVFEEETTPTPFVEESTPTPTQVEIEREGIKIQVLNGTGLSGAAGNLKTELEELGYSQIDVGNAPNQNFKTAEVIFGEDVEEAVIEEIEDLLNDIYQDVEVKEGALNNYDIRITTGYPAGHTATPTTQPKATSTPSPRPTGATGTTTLTPTQTLTPTPTP